MTRRAGGERRKVCGEERAALREERRRMRSGLEVEVRRIMDLRRE